MTNEEKIEEKRISDELMEWEFRNIKKEIDERTERAFYGAKPNNKEEVNKEELNRVIKLVERQKELWKKEIGENKGIGHN